MTAFSTAALAGTIPTADYSLSFQGNSAGNFSNEVDPDVVAAFLNVNPSSEKFEGSYRFNNQNSPGTRDVVNAGDIFVSEYERGFTTSDDLWMGFSSSSFNFPTVGAAEPIYADNSYLFSIRYQDPSLPNPDERFVNLRLETLVADMVTDACDENYSGTFCYSTSLSGVEMPQNGANGEVKGGSFDPDLYSNEFVYQTFDFGSAPGETGPLPQTVRYSIFNSDSSRGPTGFFTYLTNFDFLLAESSDSVTSVPEPGTVVLLASGLAGLFYRRKNKRQSAD
ncbi:PEP-CTERM sorting domain-containing protein [Allohahella sp. A8]|uniref:PEP-CTERM sorting domain-containing protein n=1 Tax=Allohahella sp. A8 TaxID=3141461 RepID=UPI003A7FBB65